LNGLEPKKWRSLWELPLYLNGIKEAAIAGGGTAGLTKILASLTRLASTGITGGLGNFIVATIEAAGSISLSILGLTFPLWTTAILLSVLFVAIITLLTNPPPMFKQVMKKPEEVSNSD
jgi:hypothetical protein